MARKRRRAAAEEGEEAPAQEDEEQQQVDGPQAAPGQAAERGEQQQQQQPPGVEGGGDRREGMANVARRRAAHFANFKESDDEEEGGNVHVGTTDARRLGPWSSAVELVNAREKAQQDREDKIARGPAQEKESFAWQPSRDVALGPHPVEVVRPLFSVCLDMLTEHIDCVESLWGVPDAIKVRLAAHTCARRRMSPEVAPLFSACAPAELVLPDCTQLDAAAMIALVKDAATAKLQRLELGLCGRGFGDEAASALAAAGPLPELASVSLSGAYRLTDVGLEKLLRAAPNLVRLCVGQASRITGAVLLKLPELAPKLRHLDLSDCRGVGADALCAALPHLACVACVVLDGNPEMDDAVVASAARLPCLRDLGVRYCQAVSDAGMTALAATRPELEALAIDECGKVTDAGLAAISSQCKQLRVFSARRCTRLGDAALGELASRGTLQQLHLSGCTGVGPATMRALVGCCKESLQVADLSFCRRIPDPSLGLLLDRCSKMERLVAYGLNQITTTTLYGHSNGAVRVEGLHTSVSTKKLRQQQAGRS